MDVDESEIRLNCEAVDWLSETVLYLWLLFLVSGMTFLNEKLVKANRKTGFNHEMN